MRRTSSFEEQHCLKDAILLNLEKLVQLVHLSLYHLPDLFHLFHIARARVDHNTVSITVDNLEAELVLRKIDGILEDISALAGDERGYWSREESLNEKSRGNRT